MHSGSRLPYEALLFTEVCYMSSVEVLHAWLVTEQITQLLLTFTKIMTFQVSCPQTTQWILFAQELFHDENLSVRMRVETFHGSSTIVSRNVKLHV